ncbi:hypothetical protein SAMN05216480_1053 [Pustulibacterium marinum]|uniref:Zinc-dependent peptidase n=1 Tax=Pustulibacterium marinum TaxID=1224947 RepID=A0A1I7GJJ9_9FLAO|nr:zinc-dependent peptidase [Pustulibacterium marinum]SFU48618.1 hypothetical protein SAMN05216480_1053 [Pustulibacterium marinum]
MGEEQISNTTFISVGLFALLIFSIFFYKFLDFIAYYFFRRPLFVNIPFGLKKLNRQQRGYITSHFPLYNHLSKTKQAVFDHRVRKFIEYHEFAGREGFHITDEVKVLTSSCAVLLTFGMRYFDLPSINTILIFPDVYYSTLNQNYHKGEFNPMHKTLVLSWKHFLEGFDDDKDGVNLGIHEFAHALFASNFGGSDTSADIFNEGLEDLRLILEDGQHMQLIYDSGFLRSYAFTNAMEFFAVCMETLIEQPTEFKYTLPQLYEVITEMLNFSVFREFKLK